LETESENLMSGSTSAVPGHLSTSPWSAGSPEHASGAGTAAQNWPHASLLELAALATAVPCGRLHARHVLREWGLGHFADDAEILVSELLTNAVKSSWLPGGAGLIALRLLANGTQLLVEVWDQNPGDPQPRQTDSGSESGRGLTVIEAISDRWGFRRVSFGLKVVWCELAIRGKS
jgi:anti-sigma regulatory factor (Ser/Thr protein kinase)